MSIVQTVGFLLVVFIAFTLQAMTGFGGPLIAMPLCILLAGMDNAKAVLGVIAWTTSVMTLFKTWRDVNVKELIKIVVVMFLGMFGGVWLYGALPKALLLRIFGVVVLFVALKNLLSKTEWRFPTWLRYVTLALAGVMQGLFLSGGSFLIMYAQQAFKDKKEFRATGSAVWALTNAYMIAQQAAKGMYTPTVLPLLGMSLAVMVLCVFLGGRLQSKLSLKSFIRLTNYVLLAAGIMLIVNSF